MAFPKTAPLPAVPWRAALLNRLVKDDLLHPDILPYAKVRVLASGLSVGLVRPQGFVPLVEFTARTAP